VVGLAGSVGPTSPAMALAARGSRARRGATLAERLVRSWVSIAAGRGLGAWRGDRRNILSHSRILPWVSLGDRKVQPHAVPVLTVVHTHTRLGRPASASRSRSADDE